MPQPTRKPTHAVSYIEQVRQALNRLHEPDWLGQNSPLAAPYFLGATQASGGQALQAALSAAATALWPGDLPPDRDTLLAIVNEDRLARGHKGPHYLFFLLELRYFRRYFEPHIQPRADNDLAVCDFLNISRASYFNHLKVAQEALGQKLLDVVRPTLRLERPLQTQTHLVNREEFIARCLADLKIGRSVALSGAGGVGKTTCAATLAQEWPHQPIFWYTLRPAFNDRLDSLLFSLGYYLHQQGASGLWQQLIADNGRVENPDLALAQVRGDLQQLPSPPLICLDEIDAIFAETDLQTTSQLQIREFVHSLCQFTPLLLIGLRPPPLAVAHHPMVGMSLDETAEFLAAADLTIPTEALAQLHTFTGGNLRLLHLCIALHKAGIPLREASAQLPHAPAVQTLWGRLWQRLLSDEREFLQRLCVFRSPAPLDAWDEPDVLARLQQQRLVQQDGGGGIAVIPLVRELLYADGQRFPIARREQYHLAAAEIRLARGEFTAAAHHYHLAGENALAVQVWFAQRQHEVSRGYASAALHLFQQISGRGLAQPEQEALALIQAELFQLHGDPEAGLAALRELSWEVESETAVRASLLRGSFYNALGYPHRALALYEEGLNLTTSLLNQMVHLHYQRGVTHIQQRDLDAAWQEAQLAQYEAAHLQAIVTEERGAYQEAIAHYEQALAYAQAADFEQGLARTHRELSKMWGRMAQLDKALHHGAEASRTFGHIGDRLSQEKMNSSLAAHYFQAGRFSEAIEIAVPTVAFFEGVDIPYWTAVTASTLAEAYYETGQLAEATTTAQKVLGLAEPHTQPYAYYTLGLVTRASGEWAQSEDYFRQSQQVAAENGDRYLEAYAWRALGELLGKQGENGDGRAAIQTALHQFEALGMSQEAAATRQLLSP